MKLADLREEVQYVIDAECFKAQRPVEKGWVTQFVMDAHPGIEGPDADFALLCVRECVSENVERAMRQSAATRKSREDNDRQFDFHAEGFERIQDGYIVERDGKRVLIPTALMTASELRAKAKEHRTMGDGNHAHADELDRLAAEREAVEGRA